MSKCSAKRSTIFPLPSSPHCAPMTTIIFDIIKNGLGSLNFDLRTLSFESFETQRSKHKVQSSKTKDLSPYLDRRQARTTVRKNPRLKLERKITPWLRRQRVCRSCAR